MIEYIGIKFLFHDADCGKDLQCNIMSVDSQMFYPHPLLRPFRLRGQFFTSLLCSQIISPYYSYLLYYYTCTIQGFIQDSIGYWGN